MNRRLCCKLQETMEFSWQRQIGFHVEEYQYLYLNNILDNPRSRLPIYIPFNRKILDEEEITPQRLLYAQSIVLYISEDVGTAEPNCQIIVFGDIRTHNATFYGKTIDLTKHGIFIDGLFAPISNRSLDIFCFCRQCNGNSNNSYGFNVLYCCETCC